ncbi:MAG: helix-turn-helix domain-containing protein [Candidatus Jettenia sp.]|nr:MAG: helix-turn-helix domain-containing protein [Candidatus Jettenia sp.]
MEELITIDGLSKLIPFKMSTLRRMCRLCQIPHFKIGGVYFFRQAEIEKWLESKKQKVVDKIKIELVRQVKIR